MRFPAFQSSFLKSGLDLERDPQSREGNAGLKLYREVAIYMVYIILLEKYPT